MRRCARTRRTTHTRGGCVCGAHTQSRELLAEADMDPYNPYDDYHLITIFFFFITACVAAGVAAFARAVVVVVVH